MRRNKTYRRETDHEARIAAHKRRIWKEIARQTKAKKAVTK